MLASVYAGTWVDVRKFLGEGGGELVVPQSEQVFVASSSWNLRGAFRPDIKCSCNRMFYTFARFYRFFINLGLPKQAPGTQIWVPALGTQI